MPSKHVWERKTHGDKMVKLVLLSYDTALKAGMSGDLARAYAGYVAERSQQQGRQFTRAWDPATLTCTWHLTAHVQGLPGALASKCRFASGKNALGYRAVFWQCLRIQLKELTGHRPEAGVMLDELEAGDLSSLPMLRDLVVTHVEDCQPILYLLEDRAP